MSKITGIYLSDFQAIKAPTFIKLDKLCFLYGPNSAGKSSILDVLSLVNEIVSNDPNQIRGVSNLIQSVAGFDSRFGIEYLAEDFADLSDPDAKSWWESTDKRGDYFHKDLFNKIIGKSVQVEFGSFDRFAIAIDGVPLFELEWAQRPYDVFFKPTDLDDQEDDCVGGCLTINKNSPYYSIINFEASDLEKIKSKSNHTYIKYDSNYFFDLFVQDDGDLLKIYGLDFELNYDVNPSRLGINFSAEDVLWSTHEKLARTKVDAEIKDTYLAFIAKYSSEGMKKKSQIYDDRRLLYWKLDDIRLDFSKLILGFLHQIRLTLDYSHVKGDRQVLNSDKCFSYGWYGNKVFDADSNKAYEQDTAVSNYAKYISNPNARYRPSSCANYDFVGECFKRYMPSLNSYSIQPDTYILKSPVDSYENDSLVYLYLKDRFGNKLNFNSVGSGISYVLPVFASLWNSSLSFIEQPELHLHPAAQCEMADVFIAASKHGAKAVVESHSEHILLRLMRRIRETTSKHKLPNELLFKNDEVRIYYFEPKGDGSTNVKEIRIDKYGELMNTWPGGFFSERERELFGE